MDFIIADADRREVGFMDMSKTMDIDVGDTNDFIIEMSSADWKNYAGLSKQFLFYAPDTEYGGIISNISTPYGQETVTLSGDVWRGMLAKKIIEPPPGQDYRVVSGDAHDILRALLNDMFDGFFVVPDEAAGIVIKSYSFDRYTDALTGLTKMLLTCNARLDIKYRQGHPGYLQIQAVPIMDYSDSREYSEDYGYVLFSTVEVKNGINHLICLGRGDLQEREVVHLYVSKSGKIVSEKAYTGLDERAAVYDYSSAESRDELVKYGTQRLKELMDYKEFNMTITETAAEIGDIVGGRERMTGFLICQQIAQKIVRVENNQVTIEHVVGGSVKTGVESDNSMLLLLRPNDPDSMISVRIPLAVRLYGGTVRVLKVYP